MKKSDLIIVRGAGDLATGTIHRLKKSGFRLLVLETDYPAAIRRQVALSEAVYSKSACVEGVEAVRVKDEKQKIKSVISRRNDQCSYDDFRYQCSGC